MIKRAFRGFPWIFATYLSVLLYFLIWRFSWALLAIFAVSCLLAIWRKFWGIFAVLLVVASVSGFVKAEENRQMADQPKMLTEVTPQLDTVEVNGDLLSFRAVNSGHIFQVYYTLKSQSEQAFWSHLDDNVSVTFDGALDVPESVRNFNGFDYQKYLATQGIYRVVTIKTVRSISKKTSFLDLRVLRRRAILLCETRFPKPMANYLTGLLFGYLPKDFDAEMGDIYSSLGIIHLFALSGMQVNFFIDWLRKILLRLGMRRDRVDQLMLPFSIVYAFLTGLSVSVIRALVQKSLPFRTLDNFSATFFVLLFLMPKFLLTTGGALTMLYAFLLAMLRGKFTSLDTIGIKKTLVAST
ncbi:MAG: ComEC/Rec2 family competence protein, partial [Streptococcaceae bacterium]|nr:ComEC/Rec2 family competence protein [Streptococcaceae bacterium]